MSASAETKIRAGALQLLWMATCLLCKETVQVPAMLWHECAVVLRLNGWRSNGSKGPVGWTCQECSEAPPPMPGPAGTVVYQTKSGRHRVLNVPNLYRVNPSAPTSASPVSPEPSGTSKPTDGPISSSTPTTVCGPSIPPARG